MPEEEGRAGGVEEGVFFVCRQIERSEWECEGGRVRVSQRRERWRGEGGRRGGRWVEGVSGEGGEEEG